MPLDQDPIEEESGEKEMSFLDHLEELRWHVIRSLGAVVVFTIVAFVEVNIFQRNSCTGEIRFLDVENVL